MLADKEYRLQQRAHQQVAQAISTGKLIRGRCEVCSSEKAEAHHDDYKKPLDVRWLCRRHHKMLHGQRKAGFDGDISELTSIMIRSRLTPGEYRELRILALYSKMSIADVSGQAIREFVVRHAQRKGKS